MQCLLPAKHSQIINVNLFCNLEGKSNYKCLTELCISRYLCIMPYYTYKSESNYSSIRLSKIMAALMRRIFKNSQLHMKIGMIYEIVTD